MKKISFWILLSLLCSFVPSQSNPVSQNRRLFAQNTEEIRLSVYAFDAKDPYGSSSFFNFSGHAFLSMENNTDRTIMVANMSLGGQKGMTFGTWGNKSQHKGVWYNLESFFNHHGGAYKGRVSLSMAITDSQLSTLNTFILHHDGWTPLNNCSSFAESCWNQVSNQKISAGWIDTPAHLKNSIRKFHDETNQAIPDSSPIGYYHDGQFITYKPQVKKCVFGKNGVYNPDTDPCSFPKELIHA